MVDYSYSCTGSYPSYQNQLNFTASLPFGSSDWTIEAFIKFKTSMYGSGRSVELFGVWDSTAKTVLDLQINFPASSLNTLNCTAWTGGAFPSGGSVGIAPYPTYFDFSNQNKWYHIAIVRSGSTASLYIDGNRISTTSITGALVNPGIWLVNGTSVLGASSAAFGDFYISDHRIVIGTALYTGTTYTIPSSGLTAIAGTYLLTGISASIADDGPNHYTVANNKSGSPDPGLVVVDFSGPFYYDNIYEQLTVTDSITATTNSLAQRLTSTGVLQTPGTFDETATGGAPASRLTADGNFTINGEFDEYTLSPNGAQFNGTTQYLTVPDNTAFQFGSGAFTIEGWFNASSLGSSNIYSKRSSGYNGILIGPSPYENGKFIITVANAAGTDWSVNSYHDSVDIPYNINQTYHFALTKTSNTVRFFLDGVLKYTATHSTSIGDDGGAVAIGYSFNGYLSNIRVIKGTALYTSGFTIPTRPLTAVSGTSLLTCHTSTIIDGGTANGGLPFTITNVGGATVARASASSGTTVRKQTSSSYQVYDSFDELSLAYTITPDKTLVNEGDTVTYTINAPISKSNALYYTNAGSMAAADFSGGLVYGVTPLTWSGTGTAIIFQATGITQLSTSGSGTGAVFTIRKHTTATNMATHGVVGVIPTSPGSGYQIGDTIVIDGSTLGMSSSTNNLTITVGSDWFAQGVYPTTVTGTGLGTMTAGDVNWTCPDGVYRISAVCIGGGGGGQSGTNPAGGGGGGLSYVQDWPVVPGTAYRFLAGAGGAAGTAGTATVFYEPTASGGIASGAYGGAAGASGVGGSSGYLAYGSIGFAGGNGGSSVTLGGGGGGAGGYTGVGGAGGTSSGSAGALVTQSGGNSLAGGGGGGSTGGGAGVLSQTGTAVNSTTGNGGGGGGTGLLGNSNMGVGGVLLPGSTGAILGQSGYGGSGGSNGGASSATVGGAGAIYGGGGGGGTTTGGAGGSGAFRIIWNYPHIIATPNATNTTTSDTTLLTAYRDGTSAINPGLTAGIYYPFGPQVDSTIIPFAGTYSYLFNGTTQNCSVPDSTDLDFGSGDFTVEGWVYPTSSTAGNKSIIAKVFASGGAGVQFGNSPFTAGRFLLTVAGSTAGSATISNDSAPLAFSVNTWYHFAITKTGGNVYLYLNGVLKLTAAHTTSIYNENVNYTLGATNSVTGFWPGYISNIRIVKGTALYSPTLYPTGFTPSTTPLTAVTNTKLLTLQSYGIFDASGVNPYMQIAPFLTVSSGTGTASPFPPTGFAYNFDGSTQYLTVAHSSSFVYGASDDFTIEGWFFTGVTTISKGIIAKRSGSAISGISFGTSTTTASRLTLKVANADGSAWTINDETAGTFVVNSWYNFTITKTGGYVYFYLNGLLIKRYAHTTAIYDDGSPLYIGRDTGTGYFNGRLSNIRIIKGRALYYPPSTIVNRNYPDYPFVVDNKGSIPISGGTGTLALTVGQDILQEGVQDIKLQLRSDSTSGTILATAPTVVVADTSRPLALPGGGQCWCAYPDYVSGPNLVYTGTPGVFTFTAPKGYTTVSAVAIGGVGVGGTEDL